MHKNKLSLIAQIAPIAPIAQIGDVLEKSGRVIVGIL